MFGCETHLLNILSITRSIHHKENMKSLKLLLTIVAVGCSGLLSNPSFAKDTKDSKDTSEALALAHQLNQAFIEVADKVSPAVVVIEVTQKPGIADSEDSENFWDSLPPEFRRRFENRNGGRSEPGQPAQPRSRRQARPTGRGSGIVVSADGYILTNNHVVEDADKITVRFKDGRIFTATVKGRDPQSDVAVIKIDAKGLTPAKLGDSAATKVGEFAIAIGAPFTWDYSVTIGHISGKGRNVTRNMMADEDFLQTDTSINPGNSGGPLVNLYGEVIGVNSMIYGMNTGIGFAIPINLAKQVMEHLITDGKLVRSRIGVEIFGLRDDQDFKSTISGLDDGVVIRSVAPDGPAKKAGLEASDVIVKVDGKDVKTARELKEEIAYKKVGQVVTLDVARFENSKNPKMIKVKVKTEAFPGEDGVASSDNNGEGSASPTNFGLTIRPLTKDVAEQLEVDANSGVVVSSVAPDSVAESKGIQAGDVITEVNRKKVTSVKQFRDALGSSDSKRGAIVNFLSKGTSRFTILKEE